MKHMIFQGSHGVLDFQNGFQMLFILWYLVAFDLYLARFSKVLFPLNKQQIYQVSQEMTQPLVML